MQTNNNFLYRDREWLFEQSITQGKTEKQIAKENNWTVRVIQKWIQMFGLGDNKYQLLKTLSPLQKQFVLASSLGDGHITQRGDFIVSHCEAQKDYLYWKYDLMRDCCKTEPHYYKATEKIIAGKKCHIQPSYRFNTRRINQLKELKSIPRYEIYNSLDEFGFSVWMLDDGYRDKYTWEIYIGYLEPNEYQALDNKLKSFGLQYSFRTDKRYIRFNCSSTRIIDNIIKNNIPNNLDIVKNKIDKEVHKKWPGKNF